MMGRMATIGTFDGVHRGHRSVLAELCSRCQAKGMKPLVVTFDRHPLELIAPERAPRMLMSVEERCEMLRRYVPDVVVVTFDESVRRLTAAEFMAKLRVDYGVDALLLGFNHRFGSDKLQSFEQFEAEAAKVGIEIFKGAEAGEDGQRFSSTIIRQSLAAGNVDIAAKCLSRPYRIIGTVGAGKQLGRKIGFPTANIEPLYERQMVPMTGVYACVVSLTDGQSYQAMVNIGVRPTVDDSGHVTIEAHLFDFDGDLYGSAVALDFIGRIRAEKQFGSIEELKQQLHIDAITAREILV